MTAPTLDPRKIAVEVRDRITVWPETHRQGRWLRLADGMEGFPEDLLKGKTAAAWAECGTTACAAGHIAAVAITANPELAGEFSGAVAFIAMQAMGLTGGKYTPWIFWADRTREEILDWLDAVAAGENPQTASDRLEANAGTG